MGGVKNKWGSNIYDYISTFSLFYFFRNSQHTLEMHQLLLANIFTISVLEKSF